MSEKIKLIWDFRGPNGLKTAQHHCIHLKEYATTEQLNFHEINFVAYSDMHSIAFIVVDKDMMKVFRDALKPHRGELAK